MTNILVSAISFINFDKPGAEIYATFANRLVDATMELTPWDIRIATNAPHLFEEAKLKYGDRFSTHVDLLENNRVAVGAFNQLLKYFAFKDVPEEYEWVLYLDCDAGFRHAPRVDELEAQISTWNEQGIDAVGTRTNAIVRGELADHEAQLEALNQQIANGDPAPYMPMNLFTCKFRFYNVTSENINPVWLDASMPSEHFLFVKNSPVGKMQAFSDHISDFNQILIAQTSHHPVISDMEAFEIGVSLAMAGYTMGDAGDYGHSWMFAIDFNGSNWERIKL